MKKWEYRLLVQLWDHDKQRLYWADHETDPRHSQERLDALRQEGWEPVSAFPCAGRVRQHNYLLRRPVEEKVNGGESEEQNEKEMKSAFPVR